ncbi:MAG: hypothetical protein E7675_04155 [Ruminococcaceae bacterium]|nr:hypothetical protein [Oscillospiraceae bacterium]
MKTYAPNYYGQFHCIADKCRHSCCVGWDVYIDSDTVRKYNGLTDKLGKRIRSCLTENDDGICFSMTEDGRCPFLNDKGLCEIIIEKGDEYISEICSEHPRFYNEFSHRIETGLGLSCEECARIILSQADKTFLGILSVDDEEEWEPFEIEKYALESRDRIFDILQNRDLSIEDRIGEVMRLFEMRESTPDINVIYKLLFPLERLDPSFDSTLEDLVLYGSLLPINELEIPFEKLILYFIYRHCYKAETETDFKAIVHFAFFGYYAVKGFCNAKIKKNGVCSFETLCDLARQYSAEIEYSEDNTSALIDYFYDLYPLE